MKLSHARSLDGPVAGHTKPRTVGLRAPSRVVALIPAHNEQILLPAAIRSLEEQTVAVDQIVVVSDNSTDLTPAIARTWGGSVALFESVGNTNKKAGALNQALDALLPALDDDDWVFVVDADSRVVPAFVAHALAAVRDDPTVGAVGGIFLGCGEGNLLGHLQSTEYVRYAREIGRDRARAKVLTGTATFVTARALRATQLARAAGTLPGTGYYHSGALCEDFELTLALKSLGHRCVSPKQCQVFTEVMADVPALWRQRTRWQRGALQALGWYGRSAVALPYRLKQAEMGAGILAMIVLTLVTLWSARAGTLAFQPFWASLALVFYAERLVSGWRAGRTGRRLAAWVVPEMLYDALIMAVYLTVYAKVLLRTEAVWGTATIDKR